MSIALSITALVIIYLIGLITWLVGLGRLAGMRGEQPLHSREKIHWASNARDPYVVWTKLECLAGWGVVWPLLIVGLLGYTIFYGLGHVLDGFVAIYQSNQRAGLKVYERKLQTQENQSRDVLITTTVTPTHKELTHP